ncbi:hypothetical protein DL98DRAFT_524316 [Cadophora sp. DSE1049]|nr:hypothetical protein DL98DRAFT_524316 [Cadophora sp. DSE1049]
MAKPVPGFLRIPLEIRLQIYTIALDQRLGYHQQYYFAISAVSKQIRREVLKIILANSKFFQSLGRLAKWTARAPPHLLPMISNVSIHIFRESLLPIADAPRKCLSDAKSCDATTAEWWEAEYARRAPKFEDDPPSPSWVASFLDCLKIAERKPPKVQDPNPISSAWKSFTAISEVRKIWLVIKDGSYPSPPRRFDIEQQLLLDMVAAIFKNLQELTVFSNLLSLEYIRKFHDLRTLRFTGYSTSTPAETADILCSLKSLDTVIVFRYPDHYDKDNSIITSTLPGYLSLTPEVIEKLNPLKKFQVQHMTSAVPSQHITIPVIKALRAHVDSLRSLSLGSDVSLGLDVVLSIMQSTASSRLKDLDLRLTCRQLIDHLDLRTILPNTIKHGEASLKQAPNPRFGQERFSYIKVSSSTSCLSSTKGDKTCVRCS